MMTTFGFFRLCCLLIGFVCLVVYLAYLAAKRWWP